MLPLLLASASPRRREMLERVGVPLEVRAADIDESWTDGEDPAAYVERIASAKARAVQRAPGQWVLAADTTVTIDGKILAKAADGDEAAAMLRLLSGRTHQVITAFSLRGGSGHHRLERFGKATTDVAMVEIDETAIAGYVASGEWRGKAGAYAIQGIAAAFIREVRGSVTNVIGLPLVEVLEALREAADHMRAAGVEGDGDVPLPNLAAASRRDNHRSMTASTIAERWREIKARVDAACQAAGRATSDVTIIAVSKTHPASAVREAAAAGATDFGENYAQELAGKRGECGDVRWHYIGRLQRNKAKLVAGHVALVHAVDSLDLAVELGKRAGGVQPVLIAVNVAGEASKGGVAEAEAPALARAVATTANVRLDGLMTMPHPDEDPRRYFDALRALRDRLVADVGPLPVLSMGMSSDFEAAIACGATHVRIGTAIFGERPRVE